MVAVRIFDPVDLDVRKIACPHGVARSTQTCAVTTTVPVCGRFSLETSVTIAIIEDVALRMLRKRPTVARISYWLSCGASVMPIRACEPRTEITSPNPVEAFCMVAVLFRRLPTRVRPSTNMNSYSRQSVKPLRRC